MGDSVGDGLVRETPLGNHRALGKESTRVDQVVVNESEECQFSLDVDQGWPDT